MFFFQGLSPPSSAIRTVVVQSLSCLTLCDPWTAACQASLSFTVSQSLPKLMSIESVMPSNHLILCHSRLLLSSIFPSIRVFSNELPLGGKNFRASALVLPMSIYGWLPLGLTGLISWQSRGLSRDFSAPQFESISSLVLSLLYGPTLTSLHDYWENHSFD